MKTPMLTRNEVERICHEILCFAENSLGDDIEGNPIIVDVEALRCVALRALELTTARQAERERCAKVCDNQRNHQHKELANWMAANCAAAIRALKDD